MIPCQEFARRGRKLQKGSSDVGRLGLLGDCMKAYLRTFTILISVDVSQLGDMEEACAEFDYTSN